MSQAILKVPWTPSSAAIVTSSWKNNDYFVNYYSHIYYRRGHS